jgi:UDP-N-acetylmuramoyl-L-alanyl-D-glutamate--2,6-diaminopimelate ligase
MFAALSGTNTNGHTYIDTAIGLGATVVLCLSLPDTLKEGVTYVQVKDSSVAAGVAASNFYDKPSESLKLVGVTGTNGKTTTATLLYEVVRALGYPAGLFSTVKILINDKEFPTTHTTPDAVELNRIMAEMVASGCEFCFMEVSSHSIDQNRIAGLKFIGGIFTNITQDHLDYHKTMDVYIAAKRQFFSQLPAEAFALTNIDDRNGNIMVQNSKAKRRTYGLLRPADFKSKILTKQLEGMMLNMDGIDVWTPLTGEFNAYNLLAVYAACMLLGFDQQEVLTAISSQHPVRGRFERFQSKKGVFVIVDYAHTPDAVTNVLETIKDIRTGNEKVITVIGAGGDRDKTKRPLMAKEAAKLSNVLILTSDNPRSEDPLVIIEEMKVGLKGLFSAVSLTIPDRREAIKTACTMAQPGDIVLIAGKGHETYQEIKGVKHPFDDMVEALTILKSIEN